MHLEYVFLAVNKPTIDKRNAHQQNIKTLEGLTLSPMLNWSNAWCYDRVIRFQTQEREETAVKFLK
jgi:hypothetical protein